MTNAITRSYPDAAEIMERVITTGDLAKLTPRDRVEYYVRVCESVGLNPLTRPFEYITLNGKLTLYARKDATDQLRKIYGVSLTIASCDRLEDVYIVTARATMPDGRTDESTGVVSMGNLKGDNLANALMKAETKAKRRVTLSICGLGLLDESETSTIADARPARVDVATGEVLDVTPPQPTPALFDQEPEPDPRQPLRDELRAVRQALAAAGGRPSNLRSSQVQAMTIQELQEEIALTRDELANIQKQAQADAPALFEEVEAQA